MSGFSSQVDATETVDVTSHALVLVAYLRDLGGHESMTINQISTEWRSKKPGSLILLEHEKRMDLSKNR